MADDNIQHGIDDNPNEDGVKGLELGALGGGAVGAMAGMAAGPVGAVVGAIIGGSVGSIASGAAVDVVDSIDNDNTVTGIGAEATPDVNTTTDISSSDTTISNSDRTNDTNVGTIGTSDTIRTSGTM